MSSDNGIVKRQDFLYFQFFFSRPILFSSVTDSVGCVVGVRYQAITQVKQFGAESLLGWVTASPRPAYQNAERQVIFSETVDWGQTLLRGEPALEASNNRFFLHKCLPKLSKNVSLKFQKQIRNIFGATEEIVSKRRAGIRAAKLSESEQIFK